MNDGFPNDTAINKFNPRTLLNFRPKIHSDSVKYLYLTKEYKKTLNDFLGTLHYDVGTGDIMNTAFPKDETYNRYRFICPTLPIVQGHWGGYWHLETFPIIYSIRFNENFQQAIVSFRSSIGETVGNYIINKKNGHWISDKNDILNIGQE